MDASLSSYLNYVVLLALYGQKAVARVFIYCKTFWKISTFWAFVFAEVVNCLLLAAAKRHIL